MSIYVAIFDLDGTVIADEGVYADAFSSILGSLGVENPHKYSHKGGIGVAENWPYLLDKYQVKTKKTVAQLTSETQKYFLEHIHEVDVMEGFPEFIGALRANSILTALATSNEWFVVEAILDELALPSYFDCIVTGEEVIAKKPDPALFMLAANKLSVDPLDCIVFEDSEAGIEAAKNAGMRSVGIAGNRDQAKALSKADFVVGGYQEIAAIVPKILNTEH